MASTYELGSIDKDPDAILLYTIDWSEWLQDDLLVDSFVSISPVGSLVGSNVAVDSTHQLTLAVLSGGNAGTKYVVTTRVNTAKGYRDDRSFEVVIKQR